MEEVINKLEIELKNNNIIYKKDKNIIVLQNNINLIKILNYIFKKFNYKNILLLYKDKIDKNNFILPGIFFDNNNLENININKYSILIIKRKENINFLKKLSIPIIIIN